ncbi:type II toxin-antitoxin system death-on-curing family toxin [Profundibacter amoris]|uniref:type II toxin-antitoxin system death-on-curing family toxin n=1 Tax=Profundibacter amoris TaxID=2171755 RepID=UPI0013C2A8C6|nr:type II toxin-antitoxin system death-on-curing family toxin [Profundibacter amoris]
MRHYQVTLADVLAAHDEALKYGGLAGIVSLDSIESAIGRPYSGYCRQISRKSAALMHALVQNHGFTDGNKRTALLVTELLIRRSGYALRLQNEEYFDDIIVGVAEGNIELDELDQWFKDRLIRV